MILCCSVVATVVRPIFCGLHHPPGWRPRQARTDEDASARQTLDLDIASRRKLIRLLTDPYNAKKLAEELANEHGLPVEYIRQGYLSLSDPTTTLHELIAARKLRHGGNPILRWHVSNAVARQDAAGNLKLDKAKSRKKIACVAARQRGCGRDCLRGGPVRLRDAGTDYSLETTSHPAPRSVIAGRVRSV